MALASTTRPDTRAASVPRTPGRRWMTDRQLQAYFSTRELLRTLRARAAAPPAHPDAAGPP